MMLGTSSKEERHLYFILLQKPRPRGKFDFPLQITCCTNSFPSLPFFESRPFLTNSGNSYVFRPSGDCRWHAQEEEKEEEEKVEREKPELHTDLTTSAAITLYRSIAGSTVRIFVKVARRGKDRIIARNRQLPHCIHWIPRNLPSTTRLIGQVISILAKVIPCGTATCLWMDSSWPVSFLYDLWRANAAEGHA